MWVLIVDHLWHNASTTSAASCAVLIPRITIRLALIRIPSSIASSGASAEYFLSVP